MGVLFNDRIVLGKRFAAELNELRAKDAIIVCLKESSLLTCLTLAMELRAWVYPLLYEQIIDPAQPGHVLGVIDQDGSFYSASDESEVNEATTAAVEQQRADALRKIADKTQRYEMTFDASQFNGRDIILVCDILTDPLPLKVASSQLSKQKPRSLSAAIGNATPEVAALVRINGDKTHVLDVLSGVVRDDEHYFNHTDEYQDHTKYQLTKHIATYWQ